MLQNIFFTDIDECAAGTFGCDANAECINTKGSYNCFCKAGYQGDGKTCEGKVCRCQDGPNLYIYIFALNKLLNTTCFVIIISTIPCSFGIVRTVNLL